MSIRLGIGLIIRTVRVAATWGRCNALDLNFKAGRELCHISNIMIPVDNRADGSGTPTDKAIEIEIIKRNPS